MASRFEFTSPGAAATDALFRVLAEQEALRRQRMLDEITKTKANRENQMALESLALDQRQVAVQEEQAATLRAQREAAAEANRQRRAQGVSAILRPEQQIDTDTASILREGGMGALVNQGAPQAAVNPDPTMTGAEGEIPSRRAVNISPGVINYTGTPQQVAMGRLMQSPKVSPELKDMIEAGVIDDTAIARLLEDNTGRLFRVGRDGSLMVQDPTTGQFRATTGDDAAFSKDRDQFVQEPAPQSSGTMTDPRRIATFNGIANAADRSPLIRAADRTIVLKRSIDDILGNQQRGIAASPTDPAKQLNLAYSYIQALDTYQSAVREGELGNLGMLGTQLEQLAVAARRTVLEGSFMPENVAKNIAQAARILAETIDEGANRKREEFRSRARASQVEDLWDTAYPSQPAATTPTPQGTTPRRIYYDADGNPVQR